MTTTMPIQGTVCNIMVNHHMAKQQIKFEISSFSYSGDILGGGAENLNRSRDHNCAYFRTVCYQWAWTSYDQVVYQI